MTCGGSIFLFMSFVHGASARPLTWLLTSHARADDSVQIEPLLAECQRRCIAAEAALYRSEAECGRLRQSVVDVQTALQEGRQAKVGPVLPCGPCPYCFREGTVTCGIRCWGKALTSLLCTHLHNQKALCATCTNYNSV